MAKIRSIAEVFDDDGRLIHKHESESDFVCPGEVIPPEPPEPPEPPTRPEPPEPPATGAEAPLPPAVPASWIAALRPQ